MCHTKTYIARDCGHIKDRDTTPCRNKGRCLPTNQEIDIPGNCGATQCITPPSSN
ncbi:hypothetical protein EJ04DRAFT_517584 [Polyplosphaeria fusca]|uniref:Uncharacterized protein n=1 Tax=Polyplosphaeria fusca TaxID=682080 RepID=A0A9P4QL78_9PLEO|nr:hypothetical protein EJ04DRAFT_517584 [Polyplosphaeria fusca]